ncbi:MAG: tetratricopeptide repeat protein [Terracidiphilus sp.]|jgi:Flp pilus assembly protein TadD
MSRSTNFVFAGIISAGSVVVVCGALLTFNSVVKAAPAATPAASITIDYPLNGSIFPPEITSPVFLFRDPSPAATLWTVDITFGKSSEDIRIKTPGPFMQVGENDPRAGEPATLTPQQAVTHTWQPDVETWAKIKRLSQKSPATITINGAGSNGNPPLSAGKVMITTSLDPVGAPIFYRNVPLMLSPLGDKGPITPLPPSALPLIKWQLRDISKPESHTVMENLPTCANCHSFSRDGRTLGIDMDGPRNDKGLYALVPISKQMTITNQNMIRWSSFKEHPDALSEEPVVKRFGFMSQVSPDGRYIVTSVSPPDMGNTNQDEEPGFAPGVINRLFSVNYRDVHFIQVFYPTRGLLAWYDRQEEKMRFLPGADDPKYVQTSAFWSPDGKYLIFSRALAQDPHPKGMPMPTYANDPNETQIQYDLYKIPFNDGKGGKAEPLLGASNNGMSNDFPKVSPDGKWIVFVQNKTGLLMRPDSKLWMVPFNGGKPRLMTCNTWRMNSWHTFSPNGRWLAFSSKARSAYTQLMLTHIDENGNDSPAVMVENTTAANRAINIPEFVNIPAEGIDHINPQATEFYRLFNDAYKYIENNQIPEAIAALRGAVERDPDDPLAHYGLATALTANNQEAEALPEYRKASALNPASPSWLDHLAVSLADNGLADEAAGAWRKSLALKPNDPGAETDLGTVLVESGHAQEGFEHLQKAIDLAPNLPDGHNHLGLALQKVGRFDDAIAQFQKAIALLPTDAEYSFNLGFALEAKGDFAAAIAPLRKSVELSESKNWRCLAELGNAYDKMGHPMDAIETVGKALDLALQDHNDELAKNLRDILSRYRQEGGKAQSQSQ